MIIPHLCMKSECAFQEKRTCPATSSMCKHTKRACKQADRPTRMYDTIAAREQQGLALLEPDKMGPCVSI